MVSTREGTKRDSSGVRRKPAQNDNSCNLKSEEIAQELHAHFGEHGFGMELHAFERQLAVAQPHNEPVGLGGDLEFAGQTLFLHDEGMVARGHEVLRQFAKDGLAIVMDAAGLAVHQRRGAYYFAAEGITNGLVAEADAKDGNLARELADDVDANAGVLRLSGTGRDHDALRLFRGDLIEGDLVVAANFEIFAQLAEELRQVIGKRIVVVDQQDHLPSAAQPLLTPPISVPSYLSAIMLTSQFEL